MKMKTLTTQEAAKCGLITLENAFTSYVAAAMPKGALTETGEDYLYDLFLSQFEGGRELPNGLRVQMVEDSDGEAGLPGQKYLVVFEYDEIEGATNRSYYYAIEFTN